MMCKFSLAVLHSFRGSCGRQGMKLVCDLLHKALCVFVFRAYQCLTCL